MYICASVITGSAMLDKDTLTRQVRYEYQLERKPEEVQVDQERVPFFECLEKAKEHVDDENVKECFARAQKLKKDL